MLVRLDIKVNQLIKLNQYRKQNTKQLDNDELNIRVQETALPLTE